MKIVKANKLDKLFFIRNIYTKLKQIQSSAWASDMSLTEKLSELKVREDIENIKEDSGRVLVIEQLLGLTQKEGILLILGCNTYENEMKSMLQSRFKNLEVTSAGFVQVTSNGEFKITGKGSFSLNIDCREIDNMIINLKLNR